MAWLIISWDQYQLTLLLPVSMFHCNLAVHFDLEEITYLFQSIYIGLIHCLHTTFDLLLSFMVLTYFKILISSVAAPFTDLPYTAMQKYIRYSFGCCTFIPNMLKTEAPTFQKVVCSLCIWTPFKMPYANFAW